MDSNLNLENCEQEPIKIPGLVQPQGILFALRHPDLTILQVSANIFDILGIRPEEVLNKPLSSLMDVGPVESAGRRLGEKLPRLLNPIPLEIGAEGRSQKFDGVLHRSGRILILELEKHIAGDPAFGGFGGFYEAIREVITRVMQAEDLSEVFDITCEEVRKLTGFSRVLIYKFDEDCNGQVIKEARDENFDSLMHHRFPASDIPKQARDLYLTNWLRIIPDVDYTPYPLVPLLNPLTSAPLDLSNSVLRSVSPIHLEYMRNLGQAASMSISLLRGNRLWGLISCHHRTPRFLRYENRVAAEFIGQMVSAQIAAREDAVENDNRLVLKRLYDHILDKGVTYATLASALSEDQQTLLSLVNADGLAISIEGNLFQIGETPTAEECIKLINEASKQKLEVFHTTEFAKIFSRSCKTTNQKNIGGILAIFFGEANSSALVWIRKEQIASVPWAGNPYESKFTDQDGKMHPRRSFTSWTEDVSGKSSSWKRDEIALAQDLRRALSGLAIRDKSIAAAIIPESDFRQSLAKSLVATENTQSLREANSSNDRNLFWKQSARIDLKTLIDDISGLSVNLVSDDGIILTWSQDAARTTGFLSQQAVGKRLEILLSHADAQTDKARDFYVKANKGGKFEEEMWLYRADGSSFWANLSIAKIQSIARGFSGFYVNFRDVTREKVAEEELKAAKFAAESANEAKTAFLANISHEIRTPLGAILGFAQLMKSSQRNDADRENLYLRVKKNGEQLIALINDLLDVSKAEAGRLEIEKIDIDVQSFLTDLINSLSVKIAEKAQTFSVTVTGDIPKVIYSDPTRLRQILVNLIGNSVKFTPAGGMLSLNVSMSSYSGNLDFLSLRMSDNGVGMTAEQQGRLFKPFAQADASTTRKFGGTGLGLFVSKRLAKSLGGDLVIERSNEGEGSVFLLTVDPGSILGKPTFNQLGSKLSIEKVAEEEKKRLTSLRILVVDDVQDNRDLVQQFLEQDGAEVEVAEDGLLGVEVAKVKTFDAILMDLQMPNLDGEGALIKIRSLGIKTPVIALSAHAMTHQKDAAIKAGFSDFIAKPVSDSELARVILKNI